MGGMNGGLKVAKCGNSFFYGPKSGHKGPRVVWCGVKSCATWGGSGL